MTLAEGSLLQVLARALDTEIPGTLLRTDYR